MPVTARPSPSEVSRAPRWHLAVVVAATFLTYLNALSNAFLWDDLYLIADNPLIKDWRRLPALFTSDLFPKVMPSHYYRPLQGLSNLIDYHLWGLTPFGFHLTNVLIHATAALLLYRLIAVLLDGSCPNVNSPVLSGTRPPLPRPLSGTETGDRGPMASSPFPRREGGQGVRCAGTRRQNGPPPDSPSAALIGALLFTVHPIHTEAVTYISGRSDTLAACGMLAALLCFVRQRHAPLGVWRLASLLCFLLALLAREASVVLPLLVVLADVTLSLRRGEDLRAALMLRLLGYASYLVPFAIYVALRVAAIGTQLIPTETAQTPLPLRLLTMLEVVVQYVALLLVPVNLHMEREVIPVSTGLDPFVVGAALLVLAIGVVAWLCRRRAWPVTVGIIWFFVALIPVSNAVPLATYMAEHWLYVPSMGVFLIAGWGLDQVMQRGWQQPALAGLIVALAAYGGLTMRRNADWQDGLTIYAATVRLAPQSARAWSNLGHAYQEAGQAQQAADAYQHALQLTTGATPRPGLPPAAADPFMASHQHAMVGNIYREQQRYDEARREFEAALGLDPGNVSAYNNLALTLSAAGRTDEAKRTFETALQLYPEFAAAHSNLGNLYFRAGDLAPAQVEYEAAIRLNPDYAEAYNNLGSVYFRLGRADLAEDAYRKALQINPRLDQARRNLDVVVQSRGQTAP